MKAKTPDNLKSREELLIENEELRMQVEEANDTINAIRTGQVDALIVNDESEGLQVFTLKSADQTYRLFIERMNEGAVTLNKDGLIVYSNTKFALMVGIPLSQVIGSKFLSYVPSDLKDKCLEIISKGWNSESKGEICLENNEQKLCPFLLSSSPIEAGGDKSLGIIITDMASQKENEQKLRENNAALEESKIYTQQLNDELENTVKERTKELLLSREHFKFLATNIPGIVWTAKPNGDVDYLNNRWFEFTGSKTEESLGLKWQNFIHKEDIENVKRTWSLSLRTGVTYKIEFRLKSKKDDEYKWHFGHALPFKNEDDVIIAWVGTFTNIEEQKLAMLKKDEFISLASHELKTPVTSLKAFTQILQIGMKEEGNERAVDLLGRMDRQINKLTLLISDLLDVTKINAGKINFTKEHFNLNKLLEETSEEIQRTSRSHKIVLQLGEGCDINADRNRIGQVITNLLSNAIKYSPDGDKVIVSSETVQGAIKFYVEDFGIGIAANEQPQLFTRFFRGNDERVKTFPGLGLGLYISNEIIKRHEGLMEFTSKAGKGSKFCVTLPCFKG